VSIDSYRISSPDDALLTGDGQWNSLEDQGEGSWFEIGDIGPSQLAELQRDGATPLSTGRGFNLGTIFDTTRMQELDFEFLLAEDSSFFTGEVVFGDLPVLSEGVAGDYNGDGLVNAADYTVWRNTLGDSVPNGSGADGNNDGAITSADYDFWKSQYGSAGGQTATVPEPTAGMLALLGIMGSLYLRRERN